MTARRLIGVLGVLVLGTLLVILALAFFSARDDSTIEASDGPGTERAEGASPEVKAGNVVLLFSDERLTRSLNDLAEQTGGAQTPALVSAGQAVIVMRQEGLRVPVRAVSASHQLDAGGAEDPALRAFVEHWLGRAAG